MFRQLLFVALAVASSYQLDLELEAALAAVESNIFSPQQRAGDAMAKPTICFNQTVGITYEVTGNCIAELRTKKREILIFRTENTDIGNCQIDFSVDNPGYMLIKKHKMKKDNWRDTDSLSFLGDALVETDIDIEAGEKMLVESASGTIKFSTTEDATRTGVAFALILIPMMKPCHQMISAPADTVGRVTYPGFDKVREYPANTFCEWRIQAPEGNLIKIKFNDFAVGEDVEDCEGEDFIAVDASGDGVYDLEERHCGDEKPDVIMSSSNSISVMGYGPTGDEGFCFNYIVVPEP